MKILRSGQFPRGTPLKPPGPTAKSCDAHEKKATTCGAFSLRFALIRPVFGVSPLMPVMLNIS